MHSQIPQFPQFSSTISFTASSAPAVGMSDTGTDTDTGGVFFHLSGLLSRLGLRNLFLYLLLAVALATKTSASPPDTSQVPVATPSPTTTPSPAANSAPASALDQASDLIDQGQYAAAERILQPLVAQQGRQSDEGRAASYLLAVAYRAAGKYRLALAEANALLSAWPTPVPLNGANSSPATVPASPPAADDSLDRQEVVVLCNEVQSIVSRQAAAEAEVRQARDPVHRQLGLAHMALLDTPVDQSNVSPQVLNAYEAAYHLAVQQPNTPPSLRLQIEKEYANRLYFHSPSLIQSKLIPLVMSDLEDEKTPPACLFFSLTLLHRELEKKPAIITPRLRQDVIQMGLQARFQAPQFDNLSWLLRKVFQQTQGYPLQEALQAERDGNWQQALQANRQLQKSDPRLLPEGDLPTGLHYTADALRQQAARSLPLMQSLLGLSPHPTTSRCAFLGVDHDLGSDWQGRIGKEAWVLFAVHSNDLCGGPCLLNHSFSYRARSGQPTDPVRRWRNPAGTYNSQPVEWPQVDPTVSQRVVLPLADPSVPGTSVLSFLDDHGEQYPEGCGPDLYLDVTVPAGSHLLSLPLHFSVSPSYPDTSYRIYLLGQVGSAKPVCLASTLVSLADCPGYLRARVQGPARYTLLIRRLGSQNANLPALFLDPDPLAQPAPALATAFTLTELQAGSLASSSAPSVPAVPASSSAPSALAAFSTLMAQYSSVAADSHGADWSALVSRAQHLAADSGLPSLQRSIAAWIGWQAQERDPLHAGLAPKHLAEYLTLGYADPAPLADLTQPGVTLLALARQLRTEGRVREAEQVDDAVWNKQVLNEQARRAQLPPSAKVEMAQAGGQEDALLRQLWNNGPRSYLAWQPVWVWQGEDGPAPQVMALALDAGYAAHKAETVTEALLTPEPLQALLLPEAELERVDVAPKEEMAKETPPPSPLSGALPVTPASSLTPAVLTNPSVMSADSFPVQRARTWVDELEHARNPAEPLHANPEPGKTEYGKPEIHAPNIPDRPTAGQDALQGMPLAQQNIPADALLQPLKQILTVAVSQPLLNAAPAGEKPAILLRSDELELLARALLGRDLFPTDRHAADVTEAIRLLMLIQAIDPHYSRLPQVNQLVTVLGSRPNKSP